MLMAVCLRCVLGSFADAYGLGSWNVSRLTTSVHNIPILSGDQLVSWDSNDGLRSALTGALSSGLVGHAITHSDIGGYTGVYELNGVLFAAFRGRYVSHIQ